MKKIGIMTWFTYNNYGTLLQVYALSEIIKAHNYNVEIINYKPKIHKKNLFDMNLNYIFNQIKEKQYSKKNYDREKNIKNRFNNFRKKYLNISDEAKNYYQLQTISNNMHKIVCGSDQIWSPTFFDPHYYLDFVKDNSKKIAYAPSFGVNKIDNEELKKDIKELLNRFENISVREEQGRIIVNELVDKPTKVVLDPTLLLDKKEWIHNLNIEQKVNNNKYLFCYFLSNKKEYVKMAKEMSKKLGLYIKVLSSTTIINSFEKNSIISDCGPKEFVEYINNASYVLTDSYHGILFSLNFNKPFIALKRFKDSKESQNSRVYNILKKVDLENKLCSLNNIDYSVIDYIEVNKKIQTLRKESILYLTTQLKKGDKCNCVDITNNCTGCGVCAAVCPKKCIEIVRNDEGFFEYKVNKESCINCGLCRKICGQINTNSVPISKQKLYSAYSKQESILEHSSSGGVAYYMSYIAIKNQIPVIGCTYNYKKNRAEHIIINNIDDIEKLSGSKYLQSYTLEGFKELKHLDKALVIGTPCQISSIDNYLRTIGKRDNFILVDLICHGVPSYYLWDRVIKKYGFNGIIKFRNKRFKNKKTLTINSKIIKDINFYDFFESSIIYNRCCYDCNYREYISSDIRIGDYWGKKNKNGISKVLIKTENGMNFFEEVKDFLIYNEEKNDDYFKNQQKSNLAISPVRAKIICELKNDNVKLESISKKYCRKIVIDNKIRTKLYKLYKKITKK